MKITLTFPPRGLGTRDIIAHWPPSDAHTEPTMSQLVGRCTNADGAWIATLHVDADLLSQQPPGDVTITRTRIADLRYAVTDHLTEHGKWWQ